MRTSDVRFPSGDVEIGGVLCEAAAPDAPGLVLVPDVHGVSDLYRTLGGRFAERGLTTLVVDIYAREGAPRLGGVAEAMAWIARLPDARVLGDLQAAADFLAAAVPRRRVGITGFCMGGQYALLAACSLRGLSACVGFYGMVRYPEVSALKPRSPLDAAADLACPYLGIFGEEDAIIPLEDVEELRRRLAAAGKDLEIRTYACCGHAFLNHARPEAYRPEAAADAFERAAAFLAARLAAG